LYCVEATRLFVPQRPASRQKQQWVHRDTAKQLRKKNKFYQKCRGANATVEDRRTLKKLIHQCRRLLAADKQPWLQDTFGDPSTFGFSVRKLLHPPASNIPSLQDGATTARRRR
jgi:hypothetical protein